MIAHASSLLDPGFSLTLRPMRYPNFYEMYRASIANTWSVEEIDFMALQDVQELTNFFERRSSSYRVGIEGEVRFDETF